VSAVEVRPQDAQHSRALLLQTLSPFEYRIDACRSERRLTCGYMQLLIPGYMHTALLCMRVPDFPALSGETPLCTVLPKKVKSRSPNCCCPSKQTWMRKIQSTLRTSACAPLHVFLKCFADFLTCLGKHPSPPLHRTWSLPLCRTVVVVQSKRGRGKCRALLGEVPLSTNSDLSNLSKKGTT
jgi:hypothetical protein